MKFAYSFSILRYIHDPATQEFANIGVAVYSRDAKYLDAMCTTNYGRITRMFTKIDGNRFRQIARYIQDRIHYLGDALPAQLPFEPGLAIEKLLSIVLPPDDSAFQFSSAGVGTSVDLKKTLSELFDRYVERYASFPDLPRRDDDEVWRVFREPLERRHVAAFLTPKRIAARDYEYEFQHSWKNELWHVCEPVSFDLIDAGSMLDKANRWVGRATSLADSNESFKIHVLLGEPQDANLRGTFVKAQNILNKMPGRKEFIKESEADEFAEEVSKEVKAHLG